jgi:hypothetical protein
MGYNVNNYRKQGGSVMVFGGADHGGLLAGAGTSAAPYTMSGASKSCISLYATSADTADSNRAIYAKLTLTGAAGGGEAVRAYGVGTTAAQSVIRGIHASAGLGTGGSCSGEMHGLKATLHIADRACSVGTAEAINAEVYCDGTSSAATGTVACIRAGVNMASGNQAARRLITNLLNITCETGAYNAGYMHATTNSGTITEALKILVNGNVRYIPLLAALAS